MVTRRLFVLFALGLFMVLTIASAVLAEEPHMVAQNTSQMKFVMFPGMPTCVTGAVVNGDPSKGSSIILAKGKAGCVIPWHWHTPNEHLMMVSGTARMDTRDMKPVTLHAGAFAMMPSNHQHNFTCTTACTLYLYADAAFDIHYVNAEGKELAPDDALKAVKEKSAK